MSTVTAKQATFAEMEQVVMLVRNAYGVGDRQYSSLEQFREDYDSDDVEQLFHEDMESCTDHVWSDTVTQQKVLQVYKDHGFVA